MIHVCFGVCGYGRYVSVSSVFFFQAEDGIRDLVRSRGLGDVYKRQVWADGLKPKEPKVGLNVYAIVRAGGRQEKVSVGDLSLIHI